MVAGIICPGLERFLHCLSCGIIPFVLFELLELVTTLHEWNNKFDDKTHSQTSEKQRACEWKASYTIMFAFALDHTSTCNHR
jgi:hypothetical protein